MGDKNTSLDINAPVCSTHLMCFDLSWITCTKPRKCCACCIFQKYLYTSVKRTETAETAACVLVNPRFSVPNTVTNANLFVCVCTSGFPQSALKEMLEISSRKNTTTSESHTVKSIKQSRLLWRTKAQDEVEPFLCFHFFFLCFPTRFLHTHRAVLSCSNGIWLGRHLWPWEQKR